jgi:hypothetical protein
MRHSMEHSHGCSCEARGLSRFDFTYFFPPAWNHVVLEIVFALDVSADGCVVVGGSETVVVAHSTVTGAMLWQNEMPRRLLTLRRHGGVIVIPVDGSNIVVLDVVTGHQVHSLPSAGTNVIGVCVFDGLTKRANFYC